MDIEVVTTAERLAELAPDWTRLQGVADTPYYARHHFVSAWWNAYEDTPGYQLRILVLRNNDQVVGIAPFSLVPQKRKGRQIVSLRFASHGDYMGLLIDTATVRSDTVCRLVMQHLERDPDWDIVSLGNIPSGTPFAHYLLKSREYNSHFTAHVENPYIDLDKFASFDDYSKTLGLKNERHRRNRIHRELSPKFVTVRGNSDEILERMATLHRREKNSLQEEHGRSERHSLYENEQRYELYRQIYDGAGETVTFAYESDEGRLLGYQSCYLDGNKLLMWNTAYEPDYADFSVGRVLLFEIIEQLFRERTVSTFDLGAGRYPWKFTWTDQFTLTYRLILRRPSADPPQSKDSTPTVEKPAQKASPAPRSPAPTPAATVSRQAVSRQAVSRQARRILRRVRPAKK